MKNSIKFTLAAMSLIIAASCTKENIGTDPNLGEVKLVDVEIKAVADDQAAYAGDTKSYVNENEIFWEEGDEVAVYTEADGEAYKFVVKNISGKSASFEGQLPEGKTEVKVVYPYSAAGGYDGTDFTVTMPSVQTLGSHSAAQNALLAVAAGDINNAINFKNVFGLVKINVKQEDVLSVCVVGNGVAGTVKVGTDGVITADVNRTNSIVLNSPAAMGTSDYYVAALPGTTTSGDFGVGVLRTAPFSVIDGVPYGVFAYPAKDVTVTRNKKLKFDSDNTAFDFSDSEYYISNADQLEAWNNGYASWTASDKVNIIADIDMDGKTGWTAHDFAGLFKGHNNSIKNLAVEGAGKASVFGNVSGVISDIEFGGSITCSEPGAENTVAALIETFSGSDSLSNITNRMAVTINNASSEKHIYAAGIAAKVTSGKISNCGNYGKILNSVETSGESILYIGGIAGQVDGTVAINNCLDYGQVYTNATVASVYMGAIVGSTTSKSSVAFKGCTTIPQQNSTVQITSNVTNLASVGGVVGHCAGSDSFTDCVNDIRMATPNTKGISIATLRMGGIIGTDCTKASTLTNCSNINTVDREVVAHISESGTNCYISGIIGYLKVASTLSNCSNNCKISMQSAMSGKAKAGGIVSYVDECAPTIDNCTNSGEILSNKNHSGADACIGGICGQLSAAPAVISNCTNTGNITSSYSKNWKKTRWLAGIVALANGEGVAAAKIESCITKSTISDQGAQANYSCPTTVVGTDSNAAGLTVSGCQVAGTIILAKAGKYITVGTHNLDTSNYSDYIYTGSTAPTVTDCKFYTE